MRVNHVHPRLLVLAAAGLCACAVSVSDQADSSTVARPKVDDKIDSQLLQAIRRDAGDTRNLPLEPPRVDIDRSGRALVDIRADVSDALVASIRKHGGEIVTTSAPLHSIIARIPLKQVRLLAEDPSVRFIAPAPEAITQGKRGGS